MIYLWWALGIAGYAAVGSFTYGFLMRVTNDEELAKVGVVLLPLTLAGAVGAGVLCILYKSLELIGFIRLLRWLVRLGGGEVM